MLLSILLMNVQVTYRGEVVTLEELQDSLDENESNLGYQILSDTQLCQRWLVTRTVAAATRKTTCQRLPKLSEVFKCMDSVLLFVGHTKNGAISTQYGNIKILQEAIIWEQYQTGKQLKLNGSLKPVTAPPSPDEPTLGTTASSQL
ncbi:hypothetical protein SK128_021247 [Halocaridina rubra]|uniref:Uncharacterized protein n=1 Tax=Halocaridina rubra TaxID=373956 RepID=A0AAN8XTT0_HALRR